MHRWDGLLFHGDDDLQARMFLSRVPSGLHLSVRVRDDIHFQNASPGSEWTGDSIQFAIALPSGEKYDWTAALTAKGAVASLDIAPVGVSLGAATFPLAIRRDEVAHEDVVRIDCFQHTPRRSETGRPFFDDVACE